MRIFSAYNLFSQKQKEDAETVSKSAGQVESLATVQADLASQGLSLITYLDEANLSEPYTNQWFYQPGMGWLWTNSKLFLSIGHQIRDQTRWLVVL